jgi:hypothetical protein
MARCPIGGAFQVAISPVRPRSPSYQPRTDSDKLAEGHTDGVHVALETAAKEFGALVSCNLEPNTISVFVAMWSQRRLNMFPVRYGQTYRVELSFK